MSDDELLITGGAVITLDPDLGDLPRADLLIRAGRIAAIGPDLDAPSATVIDAEGHAVLPGLLDAHRHVWQGALGGSTGRHSLLGYVSAVLEGIAPHLSAEDIYAGTLWGALQALDAGITTVADWSHNLQTPEHADAAVQALCDSGIRAIFLYGGPGESPEAFNGTGPHPADVRRMAADWSRHANERLSLGLALRGPAFSTDEATRADFALARELDLPISVHVGMAGFPATVTRLDALGVLGPDVNHAHANQLTEAEFRLIADSGGSIAITPSTETLMALGTYPATGSALRHHIPAGLGVDTVTGAGTDLFSEMRLALAAERSRTNAEAVRADIPVATVDLDQRDLLRLATVGGAQAWHLDQAIGTLSIGKRADLALVDLRSPHLDGFGEPVTSLVLGAGPADVRTVLVDGEVVKSDGVLVGPQAKTAHELVERSRERIRRISRP